MNKTKTFERLHLPMLVFLFFVCTTTLSYAQHMVSGVVKDVTGEPIIGANVVEKGTTNGSITDIDGKFSFPSLNRLLRCLFPTSGISRKTMLTKDKGV